MTMLREAERESGGGVLADLGTEEGKRRRVESRGSERL